MAIVNNLGGGGFISTSQPVQQVAGQLQQQQGLAQQNLHEQQKNAFTYLQMLPSLAQQMGYGPNEIHQFMRDQGSQIMGQLGVLGVRDPQVAFQGMVQSVTADQHRADLGKDFRDATLADLNAEADRRGLIGPEKAAERAEFIAHGEQAKAPTYETRQVGTEQVQQEVAGEGRSASEVTNISGADFVKNWSDEKHGQVKAVLDHLLANQEALSPGDVNRLNAARDIWNDPNVSQAVNIDNIFEMYNRNTSDQTITETFIEPGAKFGLGGITDPQEQIRLEKYYRDNYPFELVSPGAQGLYDSFTTPQQKADWLALMSEKINDPEGGPDQVESEVIARLLKEQEMAPQERSVDVTRPAAIGEAIVPGGSTTQTVSRPVYGQVETDPGRPATEGFLSAAVRFRDALNDPQTREAIDPGVLNSELIAAQPGIDLMTALTEVEKAKVEGNLELQKAAIENYYTALGSKYEKDLELAKNDQEVADIASAFAAEAAQTLRQYGADVNARELALDADGGVMSKIRQLLGRDRTLQIFGGASAPIDPRQQAQQQEIDFGALLEAIQ